MSAGPATSTNRGGHVLRIFREAHGLSLRFAAAGIGISPGYLSRIENDLAWPSRRVYDRIVTFYATAPSNPKHGPAS